MVDYVVGHPKSHIGNRNLAPENDGMRTVRQKAGFQLRSSHR